MEIAAPYASEKPTLRRTYKYRIYPTGRQCRALEEQLRSACDLYNAALEQRREAWRRCGISLNYYDQSAEFPKVRAAGLLAEGANANSQRYVLRQLDRAFAAFFRRTKAGEKPGFPRFKSWRRFDTLTWPGNGVAVVNYRLRLQNIGQVRVRWHRALPENAKLGEVKVTRSTDGKRWFVCFSLALPAPSPRPTTGKLVGADLGICQLVSLSTGEQIKGPHVGKVNRRKVRLAARRVARRKRGSVRRKKAATLLARHREREANRRRDHAHKLTRKLVDQFDLIAVEQLKIRNMLRSARGTVEEPGTNVAAKRGLNRSIADQGWSQLLSFLEYKAEEAGTRVVGVDPKYTSQTCSECGQIAAESRKGERFCCVTCGFTCHADVNAAKNILAKALGTETRIGPRARARTEPSGVNGGQKKAVPLPENDLFSRHCRDGCLGTMQDSHTSSNFPAEMPCRSVMVPFAGSSSSRRLSR